MRPLSAVELLEIWEQGFPASMPARAMLLLAAACPERSSDALARLPIGRRDALLLRLREWTFGPRLAGVVDCPACAERLELALDSSDLQDPGDDQAPETLSLLAEGYDVTFRLPNTWDLIALASTPGSEMLPHLLLERCVVEARRQEDGREAAQAVAVLPADQLPEQVVAAMVRQMAEADPLGDIEFALSCPACSHRWRAQFDVVSFFWREIDDWARRTLREVHLLARAYGWSESEILALSAWRRRAYLDLVL